jgi:hypothetical protein
MGLSLFVRTEGNFRISLISDEHTFMGTGGVDFQSNEFMSASICLIHATKIMKTGWIMLTTIMQLRNRGIHHDVGSKDSRRRRRRGW